MKPLTWIEIHDDILNTNLELIKQKLLPKTKLAIVIKSDAYGFGLKHIVKFLISKNINFIAVGTPQEAVKVRQCGYEDNLIILYEHCFSLYPKSLLKSQNNIICLGSLKLAQQFSKYSLKHPLEASFHLEVDIGIGKSGLSSTGAIECIKKIHALPGIKTTGLMAHLPDSESRDLTLTKKQIKIFDGIVEALKRDKITFDYYHLATSTVAFELPESQYNLVRIGAAFYGLQSSLLKKYPVPVQLALTWKTRLIRIRSLKSGANIGYGNNPLLKPTLIGIIPVGYALGLKKPHQPFVLINGHFCPLIGVNMSESYIDLNGCNNLNVGSEVVLVGSLSPVDPQAIAIKLNTTSENIITSVSRLVNRLQK